MTPREMALTLARALDSKKGKNIRVLEINNVTTLADYFVLCTGTSAPQLKALAGGIGELHQGIELGLAVPGDGVVAVFLSPAVLPFAFNAVKLVFQSDHTSCFSKSKGLQKG